LLFSRYPKKCFLARDLNVNNEFVVLIFGGRFQIVEDDLIKVEDDLIKVLPAYLFKAWVITRLLLVALLV